MDRREDEKWLRVTADNERLRLLAESAASSYRDTVRENLSTMGRAEGRGGRKRVYQFYLCYMLLSLGYRCGMGLHGHGGGVHKDTVFGGGAVKPDTATWDR